MLEDDLNRAHVDIDRSIISFIGFELFDGVAELKLLMYTHVYSK